MNSSELVAWAVDNDLNPQVMPLLLSIPADVRMAMTPAELPGQLFAVAWPLSITELSLSFLRDDLPIIITLAGLLTPLQRREVRSWRSHESLSPLLSAILKD